MSLLVHAGEGLDWTGRGRVAGVSNESVADTPLRKGYRLICQRKCLGMIAARVQHSWGPVGASLMHSVAQLACVACKLLAVLDRDPARRCLRRVGRRAHHARHARGATWLALRPPRGGERARLVLHALRRPYGQELSTEVSS